MSEIVVITQAMSTMLQGYGSYMGAQAEGEALRFNAKVNELNAQAVREKASYEAQMIRKQGARVMSAQKAGYASSGFATTSGTPLAVVAATARRSEMDALLRKYGGDVEAAGFTNQAALLRAKADSVESAGKTALWGTILTGAGQAYATGSELDIWKKKSPVPSWQVQPFAGRMPGGSPSLIG